MTSSSASSSSKKYSILFLASWYPNRIEVNGGIFVKRHAEAVAKFCNVYTLHIASDENLTNQKYDLQYTEEDNIPTVRVYYKKVETNLPGLANLLKLTRYIKASLMGYKFLTKKCGKPSLVHLNIVFPAGIFALFLKYYYNLPFIITENWTWFLPADGSYDKMGNKLLVRRIINNANAITPVSHDLKDAMINHGFNNKYCIIPNVVDVNLFQLVSEKPNHAKNLILHVSTLTDLQKNITGILKVILKLTAKRQDFELHIIGDGPERKEHEQHASELGINNRFVFFEGLKTGEQIAGSLQESDFLLLFSNYENLPCVMLEALACGIPVVATKTGGIPEHISKDRGILVETRDENALLHAIDKMLDSHKDYDRVKISQYAKENFGYDKVGMQFFEVYESLLN
ncbi:glycosyltransferase [Candidatus Amoebophilus asiaticus]|nr:glycosyltransferase [Candidatus Amoebophilus asiaticus]